MTLPAHYSRLWDSISPKFGIANIVTDTSCLGGLHRVLVLTGVLPLGLILMVMLVSTLRVLYKAAKEVGALPLRRALLAGLPAALFVVYVSVPTVSYTIFSVFNCREYDDGTNADGTPSTKAFISDDPSIEYAMHIP